jgi:fumarate reductase flavoprotein subunit
VSGGDLTGFDGPDLVVAGAGGGLVAALRAAQLGLDVLVLERQEQFAVGNNTAMSTAMIPGAGSRWQSEQGVDDSPEQFLDDIRAKTGGDFEERIARALVEVSARLVEWLADEQGLDLSLVTDFSYPGHSAQRCHTIPGRSGRRLLEHLVRQTRRENRVDLLAPATLVEVVTGRDGEVVGVVAETPNGSEEIPCRSVLLATNGFGANEELVGQHLPTIAGAVYHGSSGSQGDALRIGERLGAATGYLDAYQGHAALAHPGATLAGWATVMHGGFLVDAQGRRFGDETAGYSEFAEAVLRDAGGEAWVVLDERIHDACLAFQDFRDTVESAGVRRGDTVEEVAARSGVDPAGLAATLESAARCAAGQEKDEWGRTSWEAALAPPYEMIRVRPALFHTQGGLLVDAHARVLDQQDRPIRGLYASGGAAAGISGHGASGYLAGNGLLPAFGLALLAAEHVAASGSA